MAASTAIKKRKRARRKGTKSRTAIARQRSDPVLRLKSIRKIFGSLIANDDISIDLSRGEVLALLGENGAGKTTLMNILFGHYVADGGSIEAFGKTLPGGSPRAAIDAGIGMVHQHFTLAENLTVLDNIVLGTTPLYFTYLNRKRARRMLEDVSRRSGLQIDPDARIIDLALGERQRVEILKALYRGAKILILDEPTAVLTPQETKQLFATIRDLVADGMSVIFISHKLKEVATISDRVVVLRNGRAVLECDIASASVERLAREMVGRDIPMPRKKRHKPGAPVLEVSGVSMTGQDGRRLLNNVSFGLRRHEILGVAGVSGNGQQALFQIISGLARPTGGDVRALGESMVSERPSELVERGVARIPEDRHATGLIIDMKVWENFIAERYGSADYQRCGVLRRAVAIEHTNAAIEEFDVRCPSPETVTRLLSGGNMQKLILARTLSRNPRLILANQPTRGLDVGAVAFVHARLVDAKMQGAGVLLISEDLDELLELSDRLVVMSGGRMSQPIDRSKASVKSLGLMMTGEFGDAGP